MKFTSAVFLLPLIAAAPYPQPRSYDVYLNGSTDILYEMNAYAMSCMLTFLIRLATSSDQPHGYFVGGYQISPDGMDSPELLVFQTVERESNCDKKAMCENATWKGTSRKGEAFSIGFVKVEECEEFASGWDKVCAYAKTNNGE
jgi:hypothetical protein